MRKGSFFFLESVLGLFDFLRSTSKRAHTQHNTANQEVTLKDHNANSSQDVVQELPQSPSRETLRSRTNSTEPGVNPEEVGNDIRKRRGLH